MWCLTLLRQAWSIAWAIASPERRLARSSAARRRERSTREPDRCLHRQALGVSGRVARQRTAAHPPPPMLALARKYRPKRFDEVAVQSHVARTLQGAIARGRVAHGYLLCGPRGVGKTTLARVLAMALNCERRTPDDEGEPCGECGSCTRIWSGSAS